MRLIRTSRSSHCPDVTLPWQITATWQALSLTRRWTGQGETHPICQGDVIERPSFIYFRLAVMRRQIAQDSHAFDRPNRLGSHQACLESTASGLHNGTSSRLDSCILHQLQQLLLDAGKGADDSGCR